MRGKEWLCGVLLVAALFVCGCSTGKSAVDGGNAPVQSEEDTEKVLYENGLEITAKMDEILRSEEYLSLMGSSPEINEVVEDIAEGNYDKPSSVYQMEFSTEYSEIMRQELGKGVDGLSDRLKQELENKMFASFGNIISARSGAKVLAAVSIVRADSVFVCDGLKENRQYLYLYESGYPILITYTVGKDGAVAAAGSFLINENFKNAGQGDLESGLGEMLEITDMLGIHFREVTVSK